MRALVMTVLAFASITTTPDKVLKVGTNGKPDTSFGGGGVAATKVHPTIVSADGNGGYYVFDQTTDKRVVATHLGSNGAQDATEIVVGNGTVLPQGAVLDARGRVVLLVSQTVPPSGTTLIAYRFANLALDKTFGGGGAVTVVIPTAVATRTGPVSVGSDSSGRVLVAGSDDPNKNRNVFVVRLTETGALDPNFGGGVALGSQNGNAFDVVRVVGGKGNQVWVVANKSGTVGVGVFKWDGAGVSKGTTTVDNMTAFDATVSPIGELVAGGAAGASGALVKWNDSVVLDSAFGSGGKVALPSANSSVRKVGYDGSGRLVAVGGYDLSPGTRATFVNRYSNVGFPDATFGTGGSVTYNVPTSAPEIDPQGNAVFRAP
jgi:uncharacterized delta-60 repeat protein